MLKQGTTFSLAVDFKGIDLDKVEHIEFIFRGGRKYSSKFIKQCSWPGEAQKEEGGTSGFGGWGCWLPAGAYRACGAIAVANCYIADAGSLGTRIYGAERVYGNSSAWGGNGTFTLNGSQWVSVTSGNSNYSECASVAIYRV